MLVLIYVLVAVWVIAEGRLSSAQTCEFTTSWGCASIYLEPKNNEVLRPGGCSVFPGSLGLVEHQQLCWRMQRYCSTVELS